MSDEMNTQSGPITTDTSVETPVEQQVTETPVVETPKLDIDPRKFAALSRKEKEARALLKDIERREKALQERGNEERSLKMRLKTEPLKVLEELGVNADVLTQIMLNNGEVPAELKTSSTIDQLQEEIAALKAKLNGEESEEAEEETEESAEERAVNEHKNGISEHIKAHTEKYKLLSQEEEAADVVYAVKEAHYAHTAEQGKPEILSHDQACEAAENWMKQRLRELLAESEGKPADSQGKESSKSESGESSGQTLSNEHSTTRPTEGNKGLLDPQESLERAAALLRWT